MKETKLQKDKRVKKLEEEYLIYEGEQLRSAFTFFYFTGADLTEFREKLDAKGSRLAKRLFVAKQYLYAVEQKKDKRIPTGLAWRLTRVFKMGVTAIPKSEIVAGEKKDQ